MISTNETSEGSYIGWEGHGEDDDMSPEERLYHWRIRAKKDYDTAKAARVGSEICCPTCEATYPKKTYQHVFCKPTRKGQSSCKDRYWNAITDEKLFQTRLWSPYEHD